MSSATARVYHCGVRSTHRLASEPPAEDDGGSPIPQPQTVEAPTTTMTSDTTPHRYSRVLISPSPPPHSGSSPDASPDAFCDGLRPPPPLSSRGGNESANCLSQKPLALHSILTHLEEAESLLRNNYRGDSAMGGHNGISMSAEGMDCSSVPTQQTFVIGDDGGNEELAVVLEGRPASCEPSPMCSSISGSEAALAHAAAAEEEEEADNTSVTAPRVLFPANTIVSSPDVEAIGFLPASSSTLLPSVVNTDYIIQDDRVVSCAYTPHRPEHRTYADSTSTPSSSSMPTPTNNDIQWRPPPFDAMDARTAYSPSPLSTRQCHSRPVVQTHPSPRPLSFCSTPSSTREGRSGSSRRQNTYNNNYLQTPPRNIYNEEEDIPSGLGTAFPSPVKLSPIPTKAYASAAPFVAAVAAAAMEKHHEVQPPVGLAELRLTTDMSLSNTAATELTAERVDQTTCVWSEHATLPLQHHNHQQQTSVQTSHGRPISLGSSCVADEQSTMGRTTSWSPHSNLSPTFTAVGAAPCFAADSAAPANTNNNNNSSSSLGGSATTTTTTTSQNHHITLISVPGLTTGRLQSSSRPSASPPPPALSDQKNAWRADSFFVGGNSDGGTMLSATDWLEAVSSIEGAVQYGTPAEENVPADYLDLCRQPGSRQHHVGCQPVHCAGTQAPGEGTASASVVDTGRRHSKHTQAPPDVEDSDKTHAPRAGGEGRPAVPYTAHRSEIFEAISAATRQRTAMSEYVEKAAQSRYLASSTHAIDSFL